jgi:hypothetical protein
MKKSIKDEKPPWQTQYCMEVFSFIFDKSVQERLGVLAATCAARKRLPLRMSAIRRRLLFFIARLYSR